MINPTPLIVRQRQYPAGFRQDITFDIDSSNMVSIKIREKCILNIFESSNVATWSAAGLTHASAVKRANVEPGDVVTITITRVSDLLPATFKIGATVYTQNNTSMTLADWSSVIGGDSRYTYVIKGTDLLCVDNDLLSVSNLKAVTAIVNNGTSLTMTVAGHGFSNGNTISLLDIGGFSSDINHKPYTVSNVTANTFDITETVTGTWDSVGYLASSWITTPIIATIALPAITTGWHNCIYRNIDKTLYILGRGGSANSSLMACCVITDDTDPDFNVVKNWNKSSTGTATQIAGSNYSGATTTPSIYDAVRDRLVCSTLNGTFWLNFGTAAPDITPIGSFNESTQQFPAFFYDLALYLFSATTYDVTYDNALLGIRSIGNRTRSGVIYSQKQGRYYYKTNSSGELVIVSADSDLTSISSSTLLTDTWTATGCAVDDLDQIYFVRKTSTFSYPARTDVQIFDAATTSREDTYIVTPASGATILNKAVYSHHGNNVLISDNGSSGRLHIFKTTRSSGKKYIGYVSIGGSITDIAMNNLKDL